MEIEIIFSDAILKALTGKQTTSMFDWTPIITALGGTIIGAAASIIPQKYLLNEKQKKEAASIKSALLAEINAILTTIENRKYKKEVNDHIEFLEKENSKEFKIQYMIRISSHYNIAYNANIGKIGLLEEGLSRQIVKFYHILESIICDIGPNGYMANDGGTIDDFKETKHLIESLFEVAEGID